MQKYEIWQEGFLCTGMEGVPEKALYLGIREGENFKDACIKFFENHEEKILFNSETLTVWGCRLFDNEIDARKNFG